MAGQHKLVTIKGESGLRAILSPVGAKLVALYVPTRDGGEVQVVIGSSAHPDDVGADALVQRSGHASRAFRVST